MWSWTNSWTFLRSSVYWKATGSTTFILLHSVVIELSKWLEALNIVKHTNTTAINPNSWENYNSTIDEIKYTSQLSYSWIRVANDVTVRRKTRLHFSLTSTKRGFLEDEALRLLTGEDERIVACAQNNMEDGRGGRWACYTQNSCQSLEYFPIKKTMPGI